MRSRSLAVRLLVPAALVVLVAILATLQIGWLDDVSQADRNRRRASLQQRAQELADDFDGEIARLYTVLQGSGDALQHQQWESFARSLDAWHQAARDPQMLRAVYFLNAADGSSLLEYRPSTRTFVAAPSWPDELSPLKSRLLPAPASGPAASRPTLPAIVEPLDPSIPVLVASLPIIQALPSGTLNNLVSFRLGGGYVIGFLNREDLQSNLLPALAARYFPEKDADPYRLAVIDPRDPAHPVLARGLASGASIDAAKADARVSLFSLRPELALFSRRIEGMVGFAFRDQAAAMAAAEVTSPRRTAPSAADTSTPGRASGRVDRMQIVVDSSSAGAGNVVRYSTRDPVSWQLVLQHSAGSLDAAVAQARRRNLWLSFGILSVLAGGVLLIVTNAQRSQRLATQQMDFVATVSHELKTPLTVIRSAAQNLSAGVVQDPAQARQYGELIETEGRRLTDMVEQVLTYAGFESGRPAMAARPLDVARLVSDVVVSSRPLLASRTFEVAEEVAADLPPVLADDTAIRRAVQNLLTNAIKYGADGGWIGVSVQPVLNRGEREVRVAVSDRGRGIDPADLPHVFEPFYRGRRAIDDQIHGNGLGLALVKRIVEAHGGRVDVKSAPGEGATFSLYLPACSAETASAADAVAGRVDLHGASPEPSAPRA